MIHAAPSYDCDFNEHRAIAIFSPCFRIDNTSKRQLYDMFTITFVQLVSRAKFGSFRKT